MEQNPYFYLFTALTIALAFSYFVGARRNKKISRVIFRNLEDILKPSKKTYTNIGGLIGYNFNYAKMKTKKISRVNGVLTLIPRQSPLYLPIAKLFGRKDKLYITIFVTNVDLKHTWHIVHNKCKERIDVANLQCDKLNSGGQSVNLFHQEGDECEAVKRFVADSNLKYLRHLAYHPEDKCFSMLLKPGNISEEFEKIYGFINSLIS